MAGPPQFQLTSLWLIIRLAASTVAALAAAPGRADPPLAMTEVAAGVFVHGGVHEEASPANNDAIANIGFVLGDDAVAVIDSGGSALEGHALRAAIRARTDRPIRYVILTHVHPDHIFGAAAFRDDRPDFVGHAKLPGALAQRGRGQRNRDADIACRHPARARFGRTAPGVARARPDAHRQRSDHPRRQDADAVAL